MCLLAPITVSDWRRQTQLRGQPCQLNGKCVSLRYEVERGFPHSQLPDLSQEIRVQRRVIQRRTTPLAGLYFNECHRQGALKPLIGA